MSSKTYRAYHAGRIARAPLSNQSIADHQDAPPVKRNPSIQKYGQSSVLNASASSSASASLSSRPSMASLTTSSSVAGMNLYIPPYIQPSQTGLAPQPPHNQGMGGGSASFANLGVPQGQPQSGYTHGQGHGYIPPHMSSAATTSTLQAYDPIDALTRPLSSMSISSTASRPLPPTTPTPASSHASAAQGGIHQMHPGHRHSLGEAPWASLLPQNQPAPIPPAHTPVSRPVSAAESYGQSAWDHARLAASTPLARPASSVYGSTHGGATPVNGYPSSLQAGPVQGVQGLVHGQAQGQGQGQGQGYHRHAHSFSGLSSGEPHPSTYLKPATPQPPVPPASAPPAPEVWQGHTPTNSLSHSQSQSQSSSHYSLPTSSFPTLTSSSQVGAGAGDSYRASTPTPTSTSTWNLNQHGANGYDQRAGTPLPPVPTHSYSDPNQPQHTQQVQGHGDPYRATTPTPAHWQDYQPRPLPPQHPQAPLSSSTSSSHYYPTPPRRQSTPITSHLHSSQSQTQSQGQYQATPPPGQPNAQGYVPWYQQTSSSTSIPSSLSNNNAAPPVPDYTRPAPAPPAPAHPHPAGQVGYYPSDELYVQPPQPQHQSQQPPHPAQGHTQMHTHTQSQASPYGWQAPGQPPTLPPSGSALENAIGQRAPIGWQSTVSTSTSDSPASLHSHAPVPARQPSPSPSPAPYSSEQNYQPYQPPYNPSAQPAPHAPPTQPAQPVQQQSHTPQPSAIKQDWKSYMASLGSSGSFPARSPSPLPPAPPVQHQHQHQQGQDWYTPPPALPSSIRPQDGWNSSANAGQGQGQW